MGCEEACNCIQDTSGKYLYKYIDSENMKCSNLAKEFKPNIVLKPFNERNNKVKIDTRIKPHDFFIRVPFNSKVKLTSIVIKSSFKEIRLYSTNNVNALNWKQREPVEKYSLAGTEHFTEIFLTSKYFKDCDACYFALCGNSELQNNLYYLGFKGTYLRPFQQVIVTNYEIISGDSFVKKADESNSYVV